ncbi:MAG: acetyl-CoA acetyltransferase [Gammaproteobacteria bacterium]
MQDLTPILVGAGQYVGRDMSRPELLKSPVDIAALAAQRALDDANAATPLAAEVDMLVVIRMFEHSVADKAMWPNPFGSTNNVPWSIARRLAARPRQAIYAEVGGQSPQRLVNRMAERIHAGEVGMALLTGAEAIATIREASRRGYELDWNEEAEGEFEDRWPGVPFVTPYENAHGIQWPIHVYAMFEQVRRHARGMSTDACRHDIAHMFAHFSAVAAHHDYAQFPTAHNETFLATVSPQNYLLCEPYTKWMVAQDAVNQGAAVLMTSVAKARELGIPPSRWVYLTGYADVDDQTVLKRTNLAASHAQNLAVRGALSAAGVGIEAVKYLDFYSCFPIAVSSIAEPLGLPIDGSRPLTLTGGLPFFGGPGNNYSMHGIATVVDKLRADADAHGLVVANGGYLSKHSAAVYSRAAPASWAPISSSAAQAEAKADTGIVVDEEASGRARIETFAAIVAKGQPADGFVVARMAESGARVMARVTKGDGETLAALFDEHVIGRPITVAKVDGQHRFTLAV